MFPIRHNCFTGVSEVHIDKRVGEKIRRAIRTKYNQTELAKALNVSPSLVSKWVRGERPVSTEDLERIARLTGYPISYFFDGFETVHLDPKFSEIIADLNVTVVPIYATVNAGRPSFVMQDPEYIRLSRDLSETATFGVRVRGDSMIGIGIQDGDILLVRPQEAADHGDIVIARVNGDEYTIKRLKIKGGEAILEPANPDYKPIVAKDMHIVGKVVGLHRRFW